MEQATATILAAFIIGGFALLVGLLTFVGERVWPTKSAPIDRNAYETAYRGQLRELAGRQASKELTETGQAWLRRAAHQHRRSSRAGSNDAIGDIRSAVISSTTIGRDFRCDDRFLEQQIKVKILSRLGARPAAVTAEIICDAKRAAAFYQEIIPTQMRRLAMARIIGVTVLAVAVFLIVMAPATWSAISAMPHETLHPALQTQLKVAYALVIIGFLGSGIAAWLTTGR